MNMNMKTLSFLLAFACNPDVLILEDLSSSGVPNIPDLAAPTYTDVISQLDLPMVDILFVIDNSGSMGDEQTLLREGFYEFANYFAWHDIDYHIGVVSTDMDSRQFSGKLQRWSMDDPARWLSLGTLDLVESFALLSDLGTSGSGEERGSAAAFAALTDPLASGVNRGFRRENAPLHIIVVSDEDDSSSSPSMNEWLNFLDVQDATYNGIIGGPVGCPGASPSPVYTFAIEASRGIRESICDSDWTGMMDRLGYATSRLKSEFYLSHVPISETIKVHVDTSDGMSYNEISYTYNGDANSVVLEYVPPVLSVITITYDLRF